MTKMFPNIFHEELNHFIEKNPDLLKQWVIVISECYQYAEGICGQDFYTDIIFREVDFENQTAKGFEKKGDWRKVLDPVYIRNATKKKINGRPTLYGEVGAKYRITMNVKFGDIVEKRSPNRPYFFKNLNHYFHYSTPSAVDARDHLKKN